MSCFNFEALCDNIENELSGSYRVLKLWEKEQPRINNNIVVCLSQNAEAVVLK